MSYVKLLDYTLTLLRNRISILIGMYLALLITSSFTDYIYVFTPSFF